MDGDDELLAFGDFEIDTSVADARAARIAAARAQAKQYSAKIEEPGWFNDPVEAGRMKDPSRPALFALHQLYFERQWNLVVERGLELYTHGIKEEGETMDMIMRAWQKAGEQESTKFAKVVDIAKRWREYVNQASICHVSAQILFSASSTPPLAAISTSQGLYTDALSASLASLRLNRAQPPFLATLNQILDYSRPLLASALRDRSMATTECGKVVAEVEKLRLDATERDTLEHVLGLHGEEKEAEEDAGRDVRSL